LALLLTLMDGWLGGVLIVQHLMIVLCAYILCRFMAFRFGLRAGRVAGLLVLLSPNALYWSATFVSEALFTVGLLLALIGMRQVSHGERPAWQVGLLLGAMTLVRPIAMGLVALWGLWILFTRRGAWGWLGALRPMGTFIFAAGITLGAWSVRNWNRHGTFAVSTVSGVTVRSFHLALTLQEAERLSLEEAKAVVYAPDRTWADDISVVVQHPGAFLRVQLKGILRTILGTEVGTWAGRAYGLIYSGTGILDSIFAGRLSEVAKIGDRLAAQVPVLLLLFWGFAYAACLWILASLGLIKGWRLADGDFRSWLILIGITSAYLLVIPGASGEARFRVPAEPLLAMLGGLGWLRMRGI
jgi:hypothetical protein